MSNQTRLVVLQIPLATLYMKACAMSSQGTNVPNRSDILLRLKQCLRPKKEKPLFPVTYKKIFG